GVGDGPDPNAMHEGPSRYELRGGPPLSPDERAALARFAIEDLTTTPWRDAAAGDRAARALELLGQGVGIVETAFGSGGEIVWMNHGLAAQSPEVMRRFTDCCADATNAWRRGKALAATVRGHFRVGASWFDVVMTPFRRTSESEIVGAVALLVDATATRRIQDRLDAIDQAGAGLLQFDSDAVRTMNAAERLRALEGRVIAATRSVLGLDHFEYRLTDRRTGQLELVFCSGLVPLGIGERIFARAEGNGISGVVATSGESIVCPDISKDPRYIHGLPGACSSLTVPLRLHDAVVGVLNAESTEAAHFDEEDRLGAELLGRYVALALHILDMLVAERCDTTRTVVANLAREATAPLEAIANDARALLSRDGDAAAHAAATRLIENAARVDELIRQIAAGPRGVLGVEEFMREGVRDPVFAGREVLVADDELSIRSTVRAVLEQQGCSVSEFGDGTSAIEAIRARAAAGRPFDLVVSDVRMPDANGYEVFRAAKDANAATPVMLMTAFGYDPNHSIVRSSQEGLHCFLFKPFQVSQLLEEARKALTESLRTP
ncbi:MAG: Transcriptional regulatory protein QseF, partial [Planctomycetota bacterium]